MLLLPQFPLPPPICRFCKWRPRYQSYVMSGNPNGNVGKLYYICVCCKRDCRRTDPGHERGWITWDDDRGICPGNPNCDCGIPSVKTGQVSEVADKAWAFGPVLQGPVAIIRNS